jgi:iron(III) transport system substrate-binding protein
MKRWGNVLAGSRTMAIVAAGVIFSSSPWAPALAQSGNWNDVVAAAKKEGRVVIYGAAAPETMQRVAAGFRKAYPDIAIEAQRGSSGPMLTKVDQERNTNADGADVFLSTETSWYLARLREGKLIKPSGPALATWPARYISQGTIVSASLQYFVIGYNKTQVPVPPKGYADLLRPEFKGKIGTSNLASTLVIAWYDWLEKSQGGDYLVKLRAQNPKIYVGPPPVAQATASGEVAIGAFVNQQTLQTLIDKGAPVGMVVPSPALAYPYQLSALGWSKRPNAALVLVDYLMTRDGQTVLNGQDGAPSPLADIPGSPKVPDNVVFWDSEQYPAEVANKYRDHWSRVFN